MGFKHVAIVTNICLLICLFGSPPLLAGISISPAFIEADFNTKRPSGRFIIRNTGTETERYRIVASHFVFNNNGQLTKKKPDENSLVPWIKFNPKEFSLPPKSNRAVRYVIVPKGKIESKEYWGFMELQSLKMNTVSANDNAGRKMKLKIIPAILVPIFATKGEISYSATVEETQLVTTEKGLEIDSMVKNTGQGHLLIKGIYEMINSSGDVVEKGGLGKGYILPGGQRRFKRTINPEIPKGDFTLNVAYSAPNLKGTVTGKVQHSR
ncbi:hypothetical protein [Desulfobacula sp.]|uniref:hypothetical protein n=1 Tax=Desulfobacula sp. TaxID=2593537 RepID=UPI00260FB0B7|nr:hypothetical protein [Desulfobacula sp.]